MLLQVERAKASQQPIKVVMPDGVEKEGVRGVTTPMDVIKGISKSLANAALVAKVDGQVWDLFRPLEGDCALQVFGFDDPEGKEVRDTYRPRCVISLARTHSSAKQIHWHAPSSAKPGADAPSSGMVHAVACTPAKLPILIFFSACPCAHLLYTPCTS